MIYFTSDLHLGHAKGFRPIVPDLPSPDPGR